MRRRWAVVLVLLGACGKPAPPPVVAAPDAKHATEPPPAPPEKDAAREELRQRMREIAGSLPANPSTPALEELRRKLQSPGSPSGPPSPRPSTVARTLPPEIVEPRMFLAANDVAEAEVPAGTPLLLDLVVLGPLGKEIRVARPAASIRLMLPDASWTPQPSPAPEGDATLASGSDLRLSWTLLPEELDRLPRGTYRIGAALDASSAPGGAWQGKATARECTVKLVAANRRSSPAEETHRSWLLSRILLLRGDPEGAVRESQAQTRRNPNSPVAWTAYAVALEALGKQSEAVSARARAAELSRRARSQSLPPGPSRY